MRNMVEFTKNNTQVIEALYLVQKQPFIKPLTLNSLRIFYATKEVMSSEWK